MVKNKCETGRKANKSRGWERHRWASEAGEKEGGSAPRVNKEGRMDGEQGRNGARGWRGGFKKRWNDRAVGKHW